MAKSGDVVILRDGRRLRTCSWHADAILETLGRAVQRQTETVWDDSPIMLDDPDDDPARARLPDEWVYFVRRAGDGLVKIGTSTNVEQRIRNLENGAGPLELLHREKGGLARERQLHDQFAADRQHGEWFIESEAIKEYLCLASR